MMDPFPIIPPAAVPSKTPTALTLKKTAIIFDMDGVLTIVDDPTSAYMNWDDVPHITSKMYNAKPEWRMISMMNHFYNHSGENVAIIIATGRPEQYRAVTTGYLGRHKAKYHDLLMREQNDARHDHEVKLAMLRQLQSIYNVWFVVEDRVSVVAMWRREGIMCLQPVEGNY